MPKPAATVVGDDRSKAAILAMASDVHRDSVKAHRCGGPTRATTAGHGAVCQEQFVLNPRSYQRLTWIQARCIPFEHPPRQNAPRRHSPRGCRRRWSSQGRAVAHSLFRAAGLFSHGPQRIWRNQHRVRLDGRRHLKSRSKQLKQGGIRCCRHAPPRLVSRPRTGSVAGHVGGPLLKIVVDAGLPALVFFTMVVVGKAWPDAAWPSAGVLAVPG